MKKKIILIPLLIIPIFVFSCNNVKDGTISVDKTSITLVRGEQTIIKYKTTNGQSASGSSSNSGVVGVFANNDYMKYNGYVWLYANNNLGSSTITISANKCPSITVNVNVVEDTNYAFINEDCTIATAVPKIEKAVVEGHKTIFVKSISDLTDLKNIANYSELNNSSYDITAWGKTANGYPGFVFSHFDFDSIQSSKINNDYVNLKNANLYLRQKGKNAISSLPIDSLGSDKEILITNTDQLWWVLEHGYKPKFNNTSSVAYKCYQKARQICLDNMKVEFSNDIDKVRTIFDYMTENMKYNHWVASSINDNDDWHKYTDYFVEGPLLRNVGVCDGFSKVAVMLGGIMQINTIEKQRLVRSFGYTTNSGHAWNYYCPDTSGTNLKYYLVCPTWGQTYLNTKDTLGYTVCVSDYEAFMTTKNYFNDNGSSFSDYPWKGINKSIERYKNDPTGLSSYTIDDLYTECKKVSDNCVINVTCSDADINKYVTKFGGKNVFLRTSKLYDTNYLYIIVKNK